MILKMMSAENLSDSSAGKSCAIVSDVREVRYVRTGPLDKTGQPCEAKLHVTYETALRELLQETFTLEGNAYLMNDQGKTVSAFYASTAPAK